MRRERRDGVIYVMSDIHGAYAQYCAMLERIRFSPEDTLYVLGDVVDRGGRSVEVLRDIARRENAVLIKGNHEAMALTVLRALDVEITRENADTHLDMPMMRAILEWQANGGDVTMKAFAALKAEERADLLDMLEDAPLYDVAEAGGRTFVLVHAGLGNFVPGRKLRDYTFEELACVRPDYERAYFDDPSVYVVCGHTPTLAVTGKAEIYRSNRNILIDCGAAFGGRLACLCLDTMEEYYQD